MKKSTLMKALGKTPPKDDAEIEDKPGPAADDDDDDAIDLIFDPKTDAATRREAFRRAVRGRG
jgi:hypothetical protein